MAGQAIRLTVTPQLSEMFADLKELYPALSEAEILKLAVSEFFNWKVKGKQVTFRDVSKSGRGAFAKWLNEEKGLDIKELSEDQAYEIIKEAQSSN